MSWVGIAFSVGGSLLAASQQKKSSSQAADVQSQSSEQAIEELRRQYDLTRSDAERMYALTREDQAPFRDMGLAAQKRLATLMGLDVVPQTQTSPLASQFSVPDAPRRFAADTGDPLWDRLVSEFQKDYTSKYGEELRARGQPDYMIEHGNEGDWLREVYKKEKENEMRAAQATQQQAAPATDRNDPEFGSLTRKFSAADIEADPVYQSGLKFGLDEGRNAINARAIAGGGYDSGATLKALTKFGNDYGSQKAGDAYSRFMNDRSSIYGMLTGQQGVGMGSTNALTGTGAALTNSVAAAGQNTTNNIADLITQGGNARAAGVVAGGNAWGGASNALTGGINNYQSNKTLQELLRKNGGSSYDGLFNTGYGPSGYNWG